MNPVRLFSLASAAPFFLLVAFAAFAPAGSAAGFDCFPVYSRTDIADPNGGYITIVRRNSCAAPEFYHCPDRTTPVEKCDGLLEPESSNDTQCMDYHYEIEVGPVRHVQYDSCHSANFVCGQELRSLLLDGPRDGFVDACVAATLAPLGPIECAAIYNEFTAGPVAVIQRSSCSYDVEVCGRGLEAALEMTPDEVVACLTAP